MKNISNIKKPKIFSELERCVIALPIPVCWRDVNNRVLGGNELGLQLISAAANSEMVIGKAPIDYYPKNIAEIIIKNIQQVIKENKSITFEEQLIDINTGKERWFLTTRSTLLDDDGVKVVGVFETAVEITERKIIEQVKIEKSKKIINFTNLMVSSISHELRIPFGAINSQIDSLKATFKQKAPLLVIEKEFWKSYSNIKNVVDRAALVIRDMVLKLKVFSSGNLPKLTYTKLSIVDDVKKFIESFPFQAEEKELIKIIWGQDFKYIGDSKLTEHMLINLVKNAFDAIKNNSSRGNIIIEFNLNNKNYNQLIIKDTGIGISKEALPNIFNQLEFKSSNSGAGLGLFFCKTIMESYGGSIVCNSKLGEYTQFILNFPKVLYNTKKIKAEI